MHLQEHTYSYFQAMAGHVQVEHVLVSHFRPQSPLEPSCIVSRLFLRLQVAEI